MRLTGGLGPLLRQLSERAGQRPEIEAIRTTPWASLTFTGARHTLALRFCAKDAEACAARMADGLDYAEFELGGYLVVDIAVAETAIVDAEVRILLETLIIEAD